MPGGVSLDGHDRTPWVHKVELCLCEMDEPVRGGNPNTSNVG